MYGVYTKDQSFYGIVIEFLEHGDLRTRLDAKGTHLSNEQKWRMLMDIAQVAHQRESFILASRVVLISALDYHYSGEHAGDAIPQG